MVGGGEGPCCVDGGLAGFGVVALAEEIGVDEVEEEFGWVDLGGHWVASGSEVTSCFCEGAKVTCFAGGEQAEFVEKLERRC